MMGSFGRNDGKASSEGVQETPPELCWLNCFARRFPTLSEQRLTADSPAHVRHEATGSFRRFANSALKSTSPEQLSQIWPGSSGSGSRTGTSGFSGGSMGSWTGGGIGSAGERSEYRVGLFIPLHQPSQMMANGERKPVCFLRASGVKRETIG